MAKTSVFLSYRRSDSAASTGRIADRLQQRFGSDQIFHDIDSIELGVNFKNVIDERLDETDVFLVVIGDEWLEAKDESGARRIDDPADFVHVEVAAALSRGESFPVIPVLVGSASQPPSEGELPESLRSLSSRNAIVLRSDATFDGMMGRLIDYIEARSEERRTGLVAVPPEPEAVEAAKPTPTQVEQPTKSGGMGVGNWIGVAAAVVVAVLLLLDFVVDDDDDPLASPAVSAGSIPIPDLYGMHGPRAEQELARAGLEVDLKYTLKAGQDLDDFFVGRTDPVAGAGVSEGSVVTLYLKHADEFPE